MELTDCLALGELPVDECAYNFTSTNVQTFIQTYSLFSNLGHHVHSVLLGTVSDVHHLSYAEHILRVDYQREERVQGYMQHTNMLTHQLPPSMIGPVMSSQFEAAEGADRLERLVQAVEPFVLHCDGYGNGSGNGYGNGGHPLSKFRKVMISAENKVSSQNVVSMQAIGKSGCVLG